MKNFLNLLSKTNLFKGLSEDELNTILNCMGAVKKEFPKDSYVIKMGDYIDHIMILLEGQLCIQAEDYWGNCNVLNFIDEGDTFGEGYLAPNSGASLNNVVALKDSTILFVEVKKILTVCSSACTFHNKTVQNLFFSMSQKNKQLVTKLDIVSKRTTRDKLITYLSNESAKAGKSKFSIPFNRQQLADYLSVDRSAMSNELCKMRNEGLISFDKSQFEFL